MSDVSPTPTTAPSIFTPTRQVIFCDHLSRSGNVRAACARAGISAPTAYTARRRDHAFARAWAAALVLAREAAEAVLAERAIDGIEEVVFYRGEEIARRRRYDTRLLLAHLARLDRACEDRDALKDAGHFDTLLAEIAGAIEENPAHDWIAFRDAEVEAAMDAAREELGIEEQWDKADPEEVEEAGLRAGLDAEAKWAEREAEIFGVVDGIVGEELPDHSPTLSRHPCEGRGPSAGSVEREPQLPSDGPVGPLPAQGRRGILAKTEFLPEPCKAV